MNERARGCLVGQAVGDALGTTVEFSSPDAIALRFPKGLRDIIGGGPFDMEKGQVTDDTELALSLARSLVRNGAYLKDAVAESYLHWRASDPWDCGQATHQAFKPGLGPTDLKQFSARVQRRASTTTQANGSLMRISPLGIFGHALSDDELAALASLDSSLSHPHEVCRAACIVFTHSIALAIRTQQTGPELFEEAVHFAASRSDTLPILDSLKAAATEMPHDFMTHEGWVRVAFQCAYYQLKHAKNFEDALVTVVHAGGDTDTNAAITGALLGAAMGLAAIPRRWVTAVLECVPERPVEFHCTDLLALADKLITPGNAPGVTTTSLQSPRPSVS